VARFDHQATRNFLSPSVLPLPSGASAGPPVSQSSLSSPTANLPVTALEMLEKQLLLAAVKRAHFKFVVPILHNFLKSEKQV